MTEACRDERPHGLSQFNEAREFTTDEDLVCFNAVKVTHSAGDRGNK